MVKKVVILLVLSVIVTYLTQVIQVLLGGACSVFSGKCGLPIAFSSANLFDKPEINYVIFLVDTAFWFLIIFIILKIYNKITKK